MATKIKKIISIILSLMIIFGTVSVGAVAADSSTPTVKIISFMRGEQADLRSSELLEAHVEGYDGNVRELTYKWKSTLGTYLYVYNSHNMYNINNTDGEIEIHNTDKGMSGLSNMVGRTYNKEFSGVGYAWASVYGAGLKGSTSLVGTVTVEVYDKNGKWLCSDSHEGKYSNRKNTGFVTFNLDADMDNVVLGLFEGDKRNVKDLLGESAVVHITCVESTVKDGRIISGAEHIKLTRENGDYYITGTVAGNDTSSQGDAQVDLDITKGNCKFHNSSGGDAITTVFVFKKPTTDTTTTTLTLTGNLDDRCDYFIGGVEGTKQTDGTIIFTGLTPNTSYTVEVRGEYKDNNGATKYAYAYVYDTTKPVYQATVHTYLDGALTDIGTIHGDDVTLYLHEDKENAEYIELNKSDVGTYVAAVENGVYFPWHIEAGDHYHQAREYKLIIVNANGELSLHHYSVTYDTNGGAFKAGEEVEKEIFSSGASVKATANIPLREGYIFTGWEYNGDVFASGDEITSHISAPVILKAKWEKAVNVTINVTIDHKVDGGFDSNEDKDELTVSFLEQSKGSPAFIETGDILYFSKEDVTDEKGNSKAFKYWAEIKGNEILETKYTATAPTYEGLLESSFFGVALSKSGYEVGTIEKIKDENGNWTIHIPLKYNPDDFDLEFSVRMDEDVPKELYPDAVIVKIALWDAEKNEWVIITQQRTTETTVRPGVRVDIDAETGEGSGSYPVWKFDSDINPYGYRAVVSGFIYDNSTVIVPSERDHTKEDGEVIISYTDGNYTATMGDISDGKKYSTSLYGAYYNSVTDKQQGTLDGVITVERYNVTFDARGGTVNGKDADVAEQKYYVPSFDAYEPIMENHNFLGWYLDEKCTVPASEGELLVSDITLYAKWDRVLTGNLIVDGYYEDDSGRHIVNQQDRATHALIELEEITNDGTYNIAGQTVEIDWVDGEHFSKPVSYEFKALAPDKTYRIDIYLINYDASYQNSTTVVNSNGDIHDDYNENDFTAVYPENSRLETFVNTFLHFDPEVYFQNVEVDATRIGEGFRPADALVEYLGKEAGTDTDYGIIVQHKVEPFGVEVGMDKSTGLNNGTYGCEIWKKIFNGNLYDYQANLTKLDGKVITEWPVIVVYGDSVRWSPYNQASTGALKVTIIPMWYDIIYKWNDGTDYSETVSRGHIWSHESAVDKAAPRRVGYTFGGWYSDPECTGDPVTKINADVAKDTTVYAKWNPIDDLALTVKHVDKNDPDNVLETVVKDSQVFGNEISAESLIEDITGYDYDSASAESIIIDIDNEKNVITLYYVANTYDYTVNYLEKDTNKLLAESKTDSSVFGSEVTEKAVAVKGYIVANESIKNITIGAEENVINFYYIPDSYGYTVNYLEVGTNKVLADAKNGTADYGKILTESAIEIKGYTLVGDDRQSITVDTDNNVINFCYTANICDYTVRYLEEGTDKNLTDPEIRVVFFGDSVTENAKLLDGYVLVDDVTKTFVVDEDSKIITFYYSADKVGNGANSDNIPDKYQKKVTYKVVNGTWSNGKTADIIEYVTLLKDGKYDVNGSASLTSVPTGMKAYEGFKEGFWDVTPPSTVSGMKDETFTFTFRRSTTPVVPVEVKYLVEHYKADSDGNYPAAATETEIFSGEIGKTVTAVAKNYEGFVFNESISTVSGTLKALSSAEDILVLKLYYDAEKEISGEDTPDVPDTPDTPDTPDIPNTPDTPEIPGGNGSVNTDTKHHVVFGKTDGIGWYKVSKDGGETFDIVFGNSTYEVENGTKLIIQVGDLMGDAFTFYVNGRSVEPDEDGNLTVTVNGYMLIGALGFKIDVPDVEESLNWFQKLIKAIKDFFVRLFGKK